MFIECCCVPNEQGGLFLLRIEINTDHRNLIFDPICNNKSFFPLFIGSNDEWNTFKGFLLSKNLTIVPEHWMVLPELDSDVYTTLHNREGVLFFYCSEELRQKYQKEFTHDCT